METKNMFKPLTTLVLSLIFTGNVYAENVTITGAGATFPYPLYAKWAQAYQKATGIQLNYQSIGSGGGIKQIKAKTVDFGASDKPLSTEELQQSQLMQFPTVIGGVVPVVNISQLGKEKIRLSGEVLGDIYLGNIKKWNDPRIQSLNPDIKLPAENITVVHRSDGSGTTYLFTHYLSAVNHNWKKQAGNDTSVEWPAGIGGKGNEGVAAYVQRINGSIGYVEYAYAAQNQLNSIVLQNASGHFVSPSVETFEAAASNAHWSKDSNFAEILTNEPGDNSWPVTGATFVLMPVAVENPAQAKAVLTFFNWSYQNGKDMALALHYVPLPAELVHSIQAAWKTEIKDTQHKPLWN
jgi:phosphate transport system substrate-binding protein